MIDGCFFFCHLLHPTVIESTKTITPPTTPANPKIKINLMYMRFLLAAVVIVGDDPPAPGDVAMTQYGPSAFSSSGGGRPRDVGAGARRNRPGRRRSAIRLRRRRENRGGWKCGSLV